PPGCRAGPARVLRRGEEPALRPPGDPAPVRPGPGPRRRASSQVSGSGVTRRGGMGQGGRPPERPAARATPPRGGSDRPEGGDVRRRHDRTSTTATDRVALPASPASTPWVSVAAGAGAVTLVVALAGTGAAAPAGGQGAVVAAGPGGAGRH